MRLIIEILSILISLVAIILITVAHSASVSKEQTIDSIDIVIEKNVHLHPKLPGSMSDDISSKPVLTSTSSNGLIPESTTISGGQPTAQTPRSPTTTTQDTDSDDAPTQVPTNQGPQSGNGTDTNNSNNNNPNQNSNQNSLNNTDKPSDDLVSHQVPNTVSEHSNKPANTELSVLFYSVFIVYVSFVKLLYHNISLIRRNMTEPGILIIFGIIWELVSRQISARYDVFPKFNYRVFFYLFLPSTVLESASLLSNKWLLFNLLPILIHSIIGTLLFASSLGFTIYSLGRQNVFNLNVMSQTTTITDSNNSNSTYNLGPNRTQLAARQDAQSSSILPLDQANLVMNMASSSGGSSMMQFHNLTLSDCLIFSTIISSVDSTSMLDIMRAHQFSEKLYYLMLGENLMNNAVVLVLFDLLLDFFNTTRLTVVRIYIAILQFFTTLIGSIFIGLLLASVALASVRLTKRFQVPNALSSYQNQCQAMVETLLILKLAYLTYTLANLASSSSILSLASFGILQDQYIKQNLNLRSQFTFRQVILALKTMGYSLTYPLLGMLLVEVANTSQFFLTWLSFEPAASALSSSSSSLANSINPSLNGPNDPRMTTMISSQQILETAASVASSKLSHLATQANLHWNFKFLSIVTILTIVYRFVIVILLASFSNLLMGGQLKLKLKEQVLMAYGGLKGPLTIALVQRLIEHQEYRDKTVRNKHLFTYTVLSIIFVSTVLVGIFIRPLVYRIQQNLTVGHHHEQHLSTQAIGNIRGDGTSTTTTTRAKALAAHQNGYENGKTQVFDQINGKLSEYVSHGLNSVLGHTKSPYEKFVEFNETHIKPWLTREGLNTNWLSVFYDNLILNETLNTNHFHIVTEDPTTARQTFINRQQHQLQLINVHQLVNKRRRSSVGHQQQLDTINEHLVPSIVPPIGRNTTASPSQRGYITVRPPGAGLSEKTLLKELVLLNLKMEENSLESNSNKKHQVSSSSRRRDLAMRRIRQHNHHQPTSSSDLSNCIDQTRQNPQLRMLSTTSTSSSEGLARYKSENRAKSDKLIAKLEQRMDLPATEASEVGQVRDALVSTRTAVKHGRSKVGGGERKHGHKNNKSSSSIRPQETGGERSRDIDAKVSRRKAK